MTARIRLLIVTARPAVLALLALYAAAGLAQAGSNDSKALVGALVVVAGFLLCCVVLNDLSDERIDRVNLAGDRRRPLVTGRCNRRDFALMGATAGVVSLVAATLLEGPAVWVVAGGLAIGTAYSVRPVRIADRGALASMVLPAAYVAVPYLTGIFSVRASIAAADLVLLAGLYIGFIGRILLKDFRDVRGDALFGKRTFLVRHGRGRTCALSAVCWAAGSAVLLAAAQPTPAFAGTVSVCLAVALVLLRSLATDEGPRRDEKLISAIAIVGRGTILLLVAQLSLADAGWPVAASAAVLGTVVVLTVGQAWTMVTRGPNARLTTAQLEEELTLPDGLQGPPVALACGDAAIAQARCQVVAVR
jgi:4-hydroxybenzoate polyprenyltransferase